MEKFCGSILLFALIFLCFFPGISQATLQEEGNVEKVNDKRPVNEASDKTTLASLPQSFTVQLISRSSQPFRIVVSARRSTSDRSCLVQICNSSLVVDEISLTDTQEKELKNLRDECVKIESQFQQRLDTSGYDAALAKWVKKQDRQQSQKVEDLLLRHQLQRLNSIRINYLACVHGYGQVFTELASKRIVEFSDASIKNITRVERNIASKFKKENEDFVLSQYEALLQILTAEQQQEIKKIVKIDPKVAPELLVARAKLLDDTKEGDGNRDLDLVDDRYGIWGSSAAWSLGYDGSFSLQTYRSTHYELDYLVTALVSNSSLGNRLELSTDQVIAFETLQKEIAKINQEIGAAFTSKDDAKVTALLKSKNKQIKDSLDRIFLDFQEAWLDQERPNLTTMRTGLYFQLVRGDLGTKLGVTTKQIQSIKAVAKETQKGWRELVEKNSREFEDVLVDAVSDTKEKNTIKSFFKGNRRFVQLPLGLFGISQAK